MLKRNVIKKLNQLGSDPDRIAANLRKLGITGDYVSFSCPIANFLKKTGVKNPGVGYYRITYSFCGVTRNIETPLQVKSFIGKFDCKKYPDLFKYD